MLVLDDLHRLDHPEVFALLEALLERLPDHVAVLIGTRVEPPLALARWRAHGELMEMGPADLRFGEADASALASRKLPSADDAGWCARRWNAAMAGPWDFRCCCRPRRPRAIQRPRSSAAAVPRCCSIISPKKCWPSCPRICASCCLSCALLDELNPDLCEAVSGREDAAALLRELYRRNLFVTPIDEFTPVLRFHDLFRDFLQAAARRRYTRGGTGDTARARAQPPRRCRRAPWRI